MLHPQKLRQHEDQEFRAAGPQTRGQQKRHHRKSDDKTPFAVRKMFY